MATLKTNYKDDLFSGSRKYNMTENLDGSVSFEDVTEYEQEGDAFGAMDINATNTAVNASNYVLTDTIASSRWTANTDTSTNTLYPYKATISSAVYTATSVPMWDCIGTAASGIPTETEIEDIALIQQAYFDTTGVTLYATDAPSGSVKFRAKGV